ncbi:MAG: hypothetical protein Q8P67_27630 [archaeon]|nr:hypothetical protein [archaeon]
MWHFDLKKEKKMKETNEEANEEEKMSERTVNRCSNVLENKTYKGLCSGFSANQSNGLADRKKNQAFFRKKITKEEKCSIFFLACTDYC